MSRIRFSQVDPFAGQGVSDPSLASEATAHLRSPAALVSSGAVLLISLLVLAGWSFGIESFMTILPGYIRMKPNAAVALGFGALAILFEYFEGSLRMRIFCAAIPLIVGGGTSFEYLSGRSLGIDQLLFVDPVQTHFPGRMAPITVVNLILIGSALLARTARRWRRFSCPLALLVSLSSTTAIVGYAYGVPILYGAIAYTAMALHTGISFMLLAMATLCVDLGEPLGMLFCSRGSGGLVARRLAPIAVMIPLLLGGMFIRPSFNLDHIGLAVALTVVGCVVLLLMMIIPLARTLDRRDSEIEAARRDSLIDGLTGAGNRRQFDLQIAKEIARSLRDGSPCSLVVIDVDHFKKLNDAHGHLCGDSVLRKIAETAMATLRPSEIFYRYEGGSSP